MNKDLIERINQGQAVIGVIGLGYVGLPLALRFAEAGHPVIGLDIDSARVDRLNDGLSYIRHVPGERIAAALATGLQASSDFSRLGEADAIIICVPTPLNRYREPDLGCVLSALDACLPHLRGGQVLSLESTTYPGTTEEELLPRLKARGLAVGEDVFLVYAPEREDPGNPLDARHIPKVCAGMTAACLDVGSALYARVVERVIPVSSTRVAEMTKLLENIHRAVNIGLVNEMKMVADKMGIDIHEVIRAASTKPFGFVPYQPGPGLGGHCIPIDPFYLTWKAREFGIHTRFIELAGEVNAAMPHYVIAKLVEALNAQGKAVRNSRVLVVGVAYKKNVDDLRESPALFIMDRLHELGAQLDYSDPFVPHLPGTAGGRPTLESTVLHGERLSDYDCVLLATDHDGLDYPLIQRSARLIVDCRGRFLEPAAHIFKA